MARLADRRLQRGRVQNILCGRHVMGAEVGALFNTHRRRATWHPLLRAHLFRVSRRSAGARARPRQGDFRAAARGRLQAANGPAPPLRRRRRMSMERGRTQRLPHRMGRRSARCAARGGRREGGAQRVVRPAERWRGGASATRMTSAARPWRRRQVRKPTLSGSQQPCAASRQIPKASDESNRPLLVQRLALQERCGKINDVDADLEGPHIAAVRRTFQDPTQVLESGAGFPTESIRKPARKRAAQGRPAHLDHFIAKLALGGSAAIDELARVPQLSLFQAGNRDAQRVVFFVELAPQDVCFKMPRPARAFPHLPPEIVHLCAERRRGVAGLGKPLPEFAHLQPLVLKPALRVSELLAQLWLLRLALQQHLLLTLLPCLHAPRLAERPTEPHEGLLLLQRLRPKHGLLGFGLPDPGWSLATPLGPSAAGPDVFSQKPLQLLDLVDECVRIGLMACLANPHLSPPSLFSLLP
mmetsp:Transcript_89361/g.251629  ORF Transcript_89361/g.251629 Transcript_89361/m.251629 type:complete len:471 (-) Transcript_89361:226-1638(-)